MKVTANIRDELVNTVMKLSHGSNITDSLVIALEDYVYRKKMDELIDELEEKPVEFKNGFSAEKVRELNRKKT